MKELNVIVLQGLTLREVRNVGGFVEMETSDDRLFRFWHDQDCCESVGVHDTKGELDWLVGSPILSVKETILSDREQQWPDDVPKKEYSEGYTWTIYEFETAKGRVTIRWLGESNGYYSESVSFGDVNARD